jgi:hypothetical protein
MAGEPVDRLQRRYHESLKAVDIIQDLCSDPLVLQEWQFLEEHCYLTARLFGAFTGFAGIQASPPDPCFFFSAVSHPAFLDEAPFLTPIVSLLLNKDLPPLALAHYLASAQFGIWSDDQRIFFPSRSSHGQGLSIRWGVTTKVAHDSGTVVVTIAGDRIASFHFAQPWPSARFRPGKHLMDARFRLSLAMVDGDEGLRVKIFKTELASDGLQHAVPFWHRYFGSILEGRFTVAKNGLPVRPIFQSNHPSWEDDDRAQKVLLPVLGNF